MTTTTGASWADLAESDPGLAERGRALLYQRGDGEAFFATIAANGTPRIHPPPRDRSWRPS